MFLTRIYVFLNFLKINSYILVFILIFYTKLKYSMHEFRKRQREYFVLFFFPNFFQIFWTTKMYLFKSLKLRARYLFRDGGSFFFFFGIPWFYVKLLLIFDLSRQKDLNSQKIMMEFQIFLQKIKKNVFILNFFQKEKGFCSYFFNLVQLTNAKKIKWKKKHKSQKAK